MTMRAWTAKDIVNIPKVKQIGSLSHEVSLALYVRIDQIFAMDQGVDKVGTAFGVELPNLSVIQKGCLTHQTDKVILLHNHPYLDGRCDASPSEEDLVATEFYAKHLALMGIQLLDHIIVAQDGTYFSFRAANYLS